ncbi:alkaline phosphatase family protein [Thermodesulfobacteriota bacterium]
MDYSKRANVRFALRVVIFVLFVLYCVGDQAYAYIGPGAGFAFISSFFVLFLTGFLAFLTIITWPVRAIIIFIKQRKISKRSKVKRVVVLGLDGFDPSLAQRFMAEGALPNFLKLKQQGSFRALRTTTPSISPVAWSTFSTGVNPGKHRIFDFYTRDPNNYAPVLSSAHISTSTRTFKFGPLRFPIRKTQVKFLRKSRSFWKILGEYGIFSSILRVPISFPPEKFYGACLSAMCTPDLLGTQGTFTQFTTEDPDTFEKSISGSKTAIQIQNNQFQSRITGPTMGEGASEKALDLLIKGEISYKERSVRLTIAKKIFSIKEDQYSPWIKLEFRAGFKKKVRGIVRFLLTEMEPHLKIYMTPINIDPEKPALPISHPSFYSTILSKFRGSFATLGLAEDTWALNARVIDEGDFLKQAYDIYDERKQQLIDTLKRNRRGLVVTVFDTTDRIQHMFFRYLTPDHPANKGKDTTRYKNCINELYQKMDTLVGEIQPYLNQNDLFLIISDHGFKSFKWGINLNSWLWKEGYLVLKEGAELDAEWFANVDWSNTKAYAYGLTGIFLNIRGRERDGIINPGEERTALQGEIGRKLENLKDKKNGKNPIRRVLTSQEALKGPYTAEAPDLLVCFRSGYRNSWNSAIGKITDKIIEDNTRSWSGDHSIDPVLVPGVFFSNWKLENKTPAIEDIAPTVLDLFGLEKEGFHDGKILRLSAAGSSPD